MLDLTFRFLASKWIPKFRSLDSLTHCLGNTSIRFTARVSTPRGCQNLVSLGLTALGCLGFRIVVLSIVRQILLS
jgi:hypothetical protein